MTRQHEYSIFERKKGVILSDGTLTNLTEPVYQKLVTLSPQSSVLSSGNNFLVAAVCGVGVEDLRCKSNAAILSRHYSVHPEQEPEMIYRTTNSECSVLYPLRVMTEEDQVN